MIYFCSISVGDIIVNQRMLRKICVLQVIGEISQEVSQVQTEFVQPPGDCSTVPPLGDLFVKNPDKILSDYFPR